MIAYLDACGKTLTLGPGCDKMSVQATLTEALLTGEDKKRPLYTWDDIKKDKLKKITEVIFGYGTRIINGAVLSVIPHLETVTIPSTARTIGAGAFNRCTKLKKIVCSGCEIGSIPAFAFCGDTELSDIGSLLKEVRVIDDFAFYDCRSLDNVDLPRGLKTISYGAFGGQGNKIVIPSDIAKQADILPLNDRLVKRRSLEE